MPTVKCGEPGCNREFTNKDPITLKRMIGSHVRLKHQAELQKKREAAEVRKEQTQNRVLTAEQIEARREYQRKYRAAHKTITVPLNADEQSHRATLQKSAWWKVESEQNKRQVWCPCCGAQFAVIEGSK